MRPAHVREYATPAAFRAAVEVKLRERARRLGVPAYILRRQAALEQLTARLMKVAPGRWAFKGGFALETRLGERARVSVDLDADHVHGAEAARADLQRATLEDTGDNFGFAIAGSEELREAGVGLAVRYKLESSLAGRPFEHLQVDVTIAAPDPWDAEPARRPGLLTELGLDPIEVLLVPLERQVAEKVHAYTRTYESGGTTRARDLVDLLLIRKHERVDATLLRDAIQRVFYRRATHAVPERLGSPPSALTIAYRKEAEHLGVAAGLDEAHQLLADWLEPFLAGIHQKHKSGNAPEGAP
jgi:predicted nucleotidyltransferase component of viral defense system